MKEIRTVVVSSGIRYDLLERQPSYFSELAGHHVGGLLKVAPEHLSADVTRLMRKPASELFERFLKRFREETARAGKRQAVVPYLMAGHPGTTLDMMVELAESLARLGLKVEQMQEFTPTPGTGSTCMYYTGVNPSNGSKLYVPRFDRERRLQKGILLWHIPGERERVLKELTDAGRGDLARRIRALAGSSLPTRDDVHKAAAVRAKRKPR
jgi:uncharacterized radical SAM protein YgiQ